MKLTDLKPAPYNPRTIDDAALAGLQTSLSEFGDISGIVWNKRTGHLVAGHQRLEALKRKHGGKLSIKADAVTTPTGESFPVRVVDWPDDREKAANLAANSPFLGGSFDSAGLEAVLRDLNAAEGLSGLVEGLRLSELLPGARDLFPESDSTEPADETRKKTDEVPAGPTEWITFSTPLSAAQHGTVMRAIKLARERGAEKVSDALLALARTYQEQYDAA